MTHPDFKIIKIQNDSEWLPLVKDFEDLNLLQTIAFTKSSKKWANYEVTVLVSDNEVKSATIIRKKRISFLGTIGYISWGPLWRKKSQVSESTNNLEYFKSFLEHLKNEYAVKRGFYIIIKPNILQTDSKAANILDSLGYRALKESHSRKTLLIDLELPLDEIKSKFRSKWRNYLNKVLKNNLVIKSGSNDELFSEFISLYEQMRQRKSFDESVDVYETKKIHNSLPTKYKFHIYICYKDKKPLAAIVLTFLGNTVTYYLGASSKEGLSLGAPYLLQWEAINWGKSIGAKWYDLGGIDADSNPGGYLFKSGMSKIEVQHLYPYEIYKKSIFNSLIKLILAKKGY